MMRHAFRLRASLLVAAASGLAVSFSAYALDLDAAKIRGQANPEPVTVLQNRHFLKSWRPEAGFIVGSMLNEAYTDTRSYGVRAGVFSSEWLGFEYQMLKTTVDDTEDRTALNSLHYRPVDQSGENATLIVSPDPEVNPIRSINDFNVIAAPFYGKLNLFDRFIIYSDLYVTSGISRVETDQGVHSSFTIGAGQRFYFSEKWSVRLDFRDRIYEETRAAKKSNKNAYSVDFGASYFFL